MVFACGTGKTLIALRTAEALDTRFLLVVVPSRDLIGQWAQAARADGRREPLMAVSSLEAHKHPVLSEAGAVSTGSGEHLAYWLAQCAKKNEPATVHSVFPAAVFDLAIVDEAHRTAGGWDKDWAVIHDWMPAHARNGPHAGLGVPVPDRPPPGSQAVTATQPSLREISLPGPWNAIPEMHAICTLFVR